MVAKALCRGKRTGLHPAALLPQALVNLIREEPTLPRKAELNHRADFTRLYLNQCKKQQLVATSH
jgi:hypothetical protein